MVLFRRLSWRSITRKLGTCLLWRKTSSMRYERLKSQETSVWRHHESRRMIHETQACKIYSIHLQVKMTDPKGSDLVVTNLRTEEVIFPIPINLPLQLNVPPGCEWSSCGGHDATCWQDEGSGQSFDISVAIFGRSTFVAPQAILQDNSRLNLLCSGQDLVQWEEL